MKHQSLALHRYAKFTEQCALVLNEEWPRSLGPRVHMLEKSCDMLPYSLILLEQQSAHEPDANSDSVIGHARLCKVHGNSKACFVESVVISKSRRGQGYGRRLMEEAETHARRLGLDTIYLTTHDKQDFYAHIGYTYCQPIISLGGASNLLSEEQASLWNKLAQWSLLCDPSVEQHYSPLHFGKLFGSLGMNHVQQKTGCEGPEKKKNPLSEKLPSNSEGVLKTEITSEVPPPPVVPQSPAPPPPPPSLPPLGTSKSQSASSDVITRVPADKIYWMKKQLL